jgi:hypothetical protein
MATLASRPCVNKFEEWAEDGFSAFADWTGSSNSSINWESNEIASKTNFYYNKRKNGN